MSNYVAKQVGNYRLTRLLGEGGFAQVYLGEHVYHDNLLASGSGTDDLSQTITPTSNTVQVWSPDSDKPFVVYHGHVGPVKAVAWSPDGRYVVSGSDAAPNGTNNSVALAQVWEAKSGKTVLNYLGHNHPAHSVVTNVAWSPNGSLIASAGYDNTVQVWKAPL